MREAKHSLTELDKALKANGERGIPLNWAEARKSFNEGNSTKSPFTQLKTIDLEIFEATKLKPQHQKALQETIQKSARDRRKILLC